MAENKSKRLSLYEITDLTKKLEYYLYTEEITEDEAKELESELKNALTNKSSDVITVLHRIEDNITIITERARKLRELKKFYVNSQERLKNNLLKAMQALEINKVETSGAIISRRKSPGKLKINDITKVPNEYTKIETSIDNTKLKNAVKKGKIADDIAVIEKPDILSIK